MALTDENSGTGFYMPVQPMGGNYGGYYPAPVYYGNNGNGGFGNDSFVWLILFILLVGNNNWGNNGGFGGGCGCNNNADMLLAANANTNNLVTSGFANAATANTLSGIQSAITSGFGDTQLATASVNQNICNTGNTITAAVTNGFAQAEIANNARQIADMQQNFNAQTAATAAINNMQAALNNCCCENRANVADLKYTVATENCADRAALSDGLRDVIANQTAATQRILDKLCDQELEAEKRENANLRTQLNLVNLANSQEAQTARIIADNNAQTQMLQNAIRPQINPAYVVPNPYAYNFMPTNVRNCNCGCGCN